MLRRRLLSSPSSTIVSLVSPIAAVIPHPSSSQRHVGVDLSIPAAELKIADRTPVNLQAKALAVKGNNEIADTLARNTSLEAVQYRMADRPWEIVPQYKRRRVTDMVGILTSEHRMEMELIIEKVSQICDIDVHIVIVPTVGYVKPRVFAQSIFYDWCIGEPKGNGVMLMVSQGEATVQCLASPALQRYFAEPFLKVIVHQVMAPLLKEGDASYAVLQMTYTTANYIERMRPMWENNRLVPLHVENKLRTVEKTVYYGMTQTSSFWVCVVGTLALIWLINRILDLYCPDCGALMHHVVADEYLEKYMTSGQFLEHKNECTKFHVHKCPKCPGKRIRVYARDLYQEKKCLPCEECKNRTMTLAKNVMKLPTKYEDGIKQFLYECENCKVRRDVRMPLMRPLEDKPSEEWLGNLLKRASHPMGEIRDGKKLV